MGDGLLFAKLERITISVMISLVFVLVDKVM